MKRNLIILFCVSLVLAGFVSWFASSHPDGLERIAIDQGFEHSAESPRLTVMPDYSVPGFNSYVSTTLAGVVGTIVTCAVVMIIGMLLSRRNRQRETDAPPSH